MGAKGPRVWNEALYLSTPSGQGRHGIVVLLNGLATSFRLMDRETALSDRRFDWQTTSPAQHVLSHGEYTRRDSSAEIATAVASVGTVMGMLLTFCVSRKCSKLKRECAIGTCVQFRIWTGRHGPTVVVSSRGGPN